ncbi:MAG: RagB/SusD family nutrient uptake outer membrane protein [Muribaculaceae bacterium]|nr:RagB/SusD family nutrient uptake outer membrane protein [Bacteroides sp.]MDE6681391.1 RagB/SusD family nutrient uptake outer membrane protein [Muribaculaceae bacterium]MDE6842351.1 RagB/SusD family nutrient uptake outer membrane protein [Muribaculaceae bacterium]MDE7189636.1 RagB/SusD family nutrient uptake outer membrane protein [Muribaculaceae bacterium]
MKLSKNIISKVLISAVAMSAGATFTSCDDLLDTKPQGVFTEEQIGEDEATDIMVAAYATLLCHYFGNNESFAGPITNWVLDLRSDDALKGGDGVTMEGYMHQLEVGNVQSDNDVINFKWRNNFFSVSRCNTAIRALQSANNMDEADRAAAIGEMKALRAYYYFDMLRLFQKFPYFDETVEDPSSCRADEYTRQQIAEFIKQDLRDAYKVMKETQKDPGRFNKYVAAAILARVDLFTSDWAEAGEYAGYVISSGKYELYPNFLDMSKPEMNNQYESVMAIQFSSANTPDQYNYNNCLNCTWSEGNLYGNGDDFYLASQNLVNAFRTDEQGLPYFDTFNDVDVLSVDYEGNVDPRLDFTVGRIGMYWRSYMYNEKWCRNIEMYGQYSGKKPYPSPDSPYVEKGIVPWGASSLNFQLIRYADVLLMRAEALIEQNTGLEEARQLINDVRAKASRSVDGSYTPIDCNPNVASYYVGQYPATGWTQDYARKAVRMERRLELAMEGLRWFDLLRWGNAVEVVNAYYASEVKHHSYYEGANLSEDELYFPIPINQVDNAGDLYK